MALKSWQISVLAKISPPSRIAALQLSPGAIISAGVISADLHPSSYISPSAWKYVARQLGAKQKDPKGIAALIDMNWQFPMPDGDDAADAVLIYLAARWYKQMLVWLGPDRCVLSTYVKKPYQPKKKKEKLKNAS